MLRNLILLGIAAGLAVAVPLFYEANPTLFHPAPETAQKEPEAAAPPKPVLNAASGEPEILLGRKVRLGADARGHFSAEFKLNGRRVEALVDTGATLVAINRATARRIGINLVPADFVYQVNTANGAAKAAAAVIDELQIGRIIVGKVEAMVLEDRALKSALIGMSFLNRLEKFQVEDGGLLLVQ